MEESDSDEETKDLFLAKINEDFASLLPTRARVKQYELFVTEQSLLFDKPQWTVHPFWQCRLQQPTTVKVISSVHLNDENPTFGQVFRGQVSCNNDHYYTENNLPVIIKFFKSQNLASKVCYALHELLVGLSIINSIRAQVPTFVETFGIVWTAPYDEENEHESNVPRFPMYLSNLLENGDIEYKQPALLIEPVAQSISLRKWITDDNNTSIEQISNIYLHILGSLMLAHSKSGFIHGDLTLDNILIQNITQSHNGVDNILSNCCCINQQDDVIFIQYSEFMTVPVLQHIPRIIDYGLSAGFAMSNCYISYVDIVHSEAETNYWANDVSKLIGYSLWSIAGDSNINILVSEFFIEMGEQFIGRLKDRYNTSFLRYTTGAEDSAMYFMYLDFIYMQWMYRIVYPKHTFAVIMSSSGNNSTDDIEWVKPKLQIVSSQTFNNNETVDIFWSHLLYTFALFESLLAYVEYLHQFQLLPSDVAAYIPRAFNSMYLINFFYLPNFTIITDIQEIYLKARMDTTALKLITPLHSFIDWVHQIDFFNQFNWIFGVNSCNEYTSLVRKNLDILHQTCPYYIEFI